MHLSSDSYVDVDACTMKCGSTTALVMAVGFLNKQTILYSKFSHGLQYVNSKLSQTDGDPINLKACPIYNDVGELHKIECSWSNFVSCIDCLL